MSKPMKNGKLPLSQKKEPIVFDGFTFGGSIHDVDPKILKEVTEAGFVCRWINASKFKKDGNVHKNGWRPYRARNTEPRAQDPNSFVDFSYGVTPEGYIQRGDNLLAVMPKPMAEARQEQMKEKNRRAMVLDKDKAQELREKMREAGAGGVFEGYEDNSDE